MSQGSVLTAGRGLPVHAAFAGGLHDSDKTWEGHREKLPLEELAEECGPEDVLRGIREGRLQLWTAPRAAIVTEVIQYPRSKVIYLTLAGGEVEELKAMESLVTAWARDIGCVRAEIICGRPWHRILGGYQEIGLRLVQRL